MIASGALLWALAVAAIGIFIVASGTESACNGWPLCNNSLAAPGSTDGMLLLSHRVAALGLIVGSGLLIYWAWTRLSDERWLVRLAASAFALTLAQAVLGGLGVAFEFPGWLGVVHVTLSTILCVILLGIVLLTLSRSEASLPDGATGLAVLGAVAISFALLLNPSAVSLESLSWSSAGGATAGVLLLAAVAIGSIVLMLRQTNHRFGRIGTLLGVAGLIAAGALALMDASSGWNAVPDLLLWGAVLALLATAIDGNADHVRGWLQREILIDRAGLKEQLRGYARVSKPGIMLLLLTTTFCSMLAAQAGWPGLSLVLLTLLGGALASGGASAMNCYIDRDIDQIMARTRKRPIPTRSLTAAQVRGYAVTLSVASVVLLAIWVNPLAALLALAGNLFYILIYTAWLKRSTPQNIVIGGAAGSFPPLVGWAAVTGNLAIAPLILAAIVFLWTPPHFWSLAILKKRDYERAGIPMMPVMRGEAHTRLEILLYTLILVPVTLLLVPAGGAGVFYLGAATILGAVFISYAVRMYREGNARLAWPLFKYSNYYLAALLAALVVDALIR